MVSGGDGPNPAERLVDAPDLGAALDNERFKQFLDLAPVGIAVAELPPPERIVYANRELLRLTAQPDGGLVGRGWDVLTGIDDARDARRSLAAAVTEASDHLGVFAALRGDASIRLDAWSNLIQGDDGAPVFRLVALVERADAQDTVEPDLADRIAVKDLQLRELQHRVKNNLQMITSLIRFEARGLHGGSPGERFNRLAGRVEALAMLYRAMDETGNRESVDLGVYLSEIASAVMRAHAPEGVHLDLQVDTWPVSINVAMPTGLVVNELLTNVLKHAFQGRDGGHVHLHALVEESVCRVVVADDGVGLPEGTTWPVPGKMSALFVRSLTQNARADITVASPPGGGMKVEIVFSSDQAHPAPDA